MAEPVTTAALTIAGLGWIGTTVAGGTVGNTSDRGFCNVLRGVKERVAGLHGAPEDNDVAKAVRTAQMQALERLIRDYEEINTHDWTSERHLRPFLRRSLKFCRQTVGRCLDPRFKLNLDVTEPLTVAIDGILAPPVYTGPARERRQVLASLAEEAVLDELRGMLAGVPLPDGFETHFRKGASDRRPRFLELFGAYIAEQLKENESFRVIFTTGQLARIEGLAFDAIEMLARIETRFGGTLERLSDTTNKISATQDAHGAVLEELLAFARAGGAFQRAAEQGIPEESVRALVERLGGGDIGRDDLISWVDNWIEAARRELGRQTNEGEALEAARREAKRRFEQGRLKDASAPFMDEFAREEREEQERQDERKRRRLRLLEEAIRFDELAFDGEAAVEKLQLMAAVEGISGPDSRGEWLFNKAGEFYQRGDQQGENAALVIAISTFRAALKEYIRARVPLDWAMTQNNLGAALLSLGERKSGTARLEESVRAFRAALKERTRARVPLQWAMTQNNLGAALWRLGKRESGTARLEESVQAFRAALKERTRARVPLDWAMTQNNRGNALLMLGVRAQNRAKLEEAREAVGGAFEVYMQAGQEHRRAYFEDLLSEIDEQLAEMAEAPPS